MVEVCSTCLSTDRLLNQLNQIQWFHVKTTLWEWFDPAGNGNYNVNLDAFKLCWECTALLERVQKFKNQVFRAQRLMLKNTQEQSQSLTKLSILSYRTKNKYDRTFVHNEGANDLTTQQPKTGTGDNDVILVSSTIPEPEKKVSGEEPINDNTAVGSNDNETNNNSDTTDAYLDDLTILLFKTQKEPEVESDDDDFAFIFPTTPQLENGKYEITPPSLLQGAKNNNNTCKPTGSIETKETNNSETAGDVDLENKITEKEPINDNTAIGSNDNKKKKNSATTSDKDLENNLTEEKPINDSTANFSDVGLPNNTTNVKHLLKGADKEKQKNKNKNSQDSNNKHKKRKIEEKPFDENESLMKIAKREKDRAANTTPLPKKVQLARPGVKFTIVDLNEKQMLKTREIEKEAGSYQKRDFKCCHCNIGFDGEKQLFNHNKEKHSTVSKIILAVT